MAYRPDVNDPFYGGEKVPTLSWRDLPVGSTFTVEVLEEAKALQGRNYDTNEPDWWDAARTQPKMNAVINVLVRQGPHSVGEQRSIWAQIPSKMFLALKDAQKAAGAKLAPGGILHLRFDGEEPHKDKKKNAIKLYAAKYEPAAQADPFGDASPTQTPQPARQAWVTAARPATPSTPTKGW